MDDEERREKARQYARAYRQSESGKAATARYWASERGQSALKRKGRTEAAKLAQERYLASDKYVETRRQSQHRRAAYAKEYEARMRLVHPEREKARAAVRWAIRSGYMMRPGSCFKCGRAVAVEAHHFAGYDAPNWLNVAWLCRKCHRGIHYKT